MKSIIPFDIILPNIRSCHNVGAFFRTADAIGVRKLYLVGWTSTPPKPQIDKVALGAETWMEWEHRPDLAALIQELKSAGTIVYALEKSELSKDIDELDIPDGSVALIVGNEVNGVSEEIQQLCDGVVHINMYGKKESLNVSVAGGIAMHVVGSKMRKLRAN